MLCTSGIPIKPQLEYMLAKRSMPQSGLPVVRIRTGGKDGGYEMRQKSEQIGDEQPLGEMSGILGLQRYDGEHRINDHEQQIGEYLAAIFVDQLHPEAKAAEQ